MFYKNDGPTRQGQEMKTSLHHDNNECCEGSMENGVTNEGNILWHVA